MTHPKSGSPLFGIGLKILSVTIFVAMASFIKAAKGVPPGELVFFRSLFAMIPILIFLSYRGELIEGFRTSRLSGHILRGIVGVTAMSLLFLSLTKLPLPEATILGYAMPLVAVILSALILKENVRIYRWSAVLVGLVGVGIVVWPRLSLITRGAPLTGDETIGVAAALGGAVLAAFAMIAVRNLVRTEKSGTVVIYFSIIASLTSLLTLPFGWVLPTPQQLLMLVGAGLAGGIAQILVTESYRHAPMSVIAPFEYVSMLLAIVVGYVAFGDLPTLEMLAGGALIVAAGVFIILREHRLGLERAAAKKVTTPHA